ncbi:daxx-like protein isoform X1 [Onthophagus taurus]|uniref:daxx-like protein isoform X1 n=1 Tax=Onthophagus taurus TaxID=166361 RepID=UPI0039BEBBBD
MSETVEILSSDDEECVMSNSLKRKIEEMEKEESENSDVNNASKHPKLEENINSLDEEKENIAQTNKVAENGEIPSRHTHLEEILRLFSSSEKLVELLQMLYKKFTSSKIQNTFMDKIRLLKPHFDNVTNYINSEKFTNLIQSKIETSRNAITSLALQQFVDVFKEIEIASKRATTNTSSFNEKAIAKLECFLDKLNAKIHKLENAEVNFDDEENSTYIQLERYKRRAFEVYKKLCSYYKQSVYIGDLSRTRLDFCASQTNEINIAINKVFRDGTTFPDYSQIEEIIRECVDEKKLNYTENRIKNEAEFCFRKLGNLLQRRRQLELYNMHTYYLGSNSEPSEDEELLEKLNQHKNDAKEKMSKICEKFVKLQNEGKELTISDDSDDSEYEYSDDD